MVHLIPTEQAADEQVLVDSKRLLANSSRISKISWTPGRPGQGRQGFPGPRGLFLSLLTFSGQILIGKQKIWPANQKRYYF